jgi:release factor glutamine methyltransferase
MTEDNLKQQIQWLLKEKYNGHATEEFDKDVERLEAGEPLDFIIGFVDFLDCKIDLSKRTLIPRVETEFWVDQVLEDLDYSAKLRILDIFSGSGCIGIAVLKKLPNSCVVLSDSEVIAIEQIRINAGLNNIDPSRYQIIRSDLFENITGKFDIIFANPPYISLKNQDQIQKSVLKYEPKPALFGGDDGLLYIEALLAQAKDFLGDQGKIYIEFDPPQENEIVKMIKRHGYSGHGFIKDQYNRLRCVYVAK